MSAAVVAPSAAATAADFTIFIHSPCGCCSTALDRRRPIVSPVEGRECNKTVMRERRRRANPVHSSGVTGGNTSGPEAVAAGAVRGAVTGFGRGSGAAAARAPRPCGTEAGGRRIWPSNGLNALGGREAAGPQHAKVRTAQHAITVLMSRLLEAPLPGRNIESTGAEFARRLRRRL